MIKNTLENKLRFFTQYWGQFVLLNEDWDEDNDGIFEVHTKSMLFVEEDGGEGYYLKLKPLSKMTRKNIKKCMFETNSELKLDFDGSKWTASNKDGFYLGEGYLLPENVDYLRAKGFAVGWRGLKVEQLQKYGWIKLDL